MTPPKHNPIILMMALLMATATSACKVYVGLEWSSTDNNDIDDIPRVWGWSYTSFDGVCGNGDLGLAYDEQPPGNSKCKRQRGTNSSERET